MRKSSKKLQPVANLASQNERNAARQHGSVLNELKKQEQQLEELIGYRDQYLDTFSTVGRSGLSAIQLQDYRIFIRRLDDAIKQQKEMVLIGIRNSEESKGKWIDTRNRSKMIDKVVENRKLTESKSQDRSEQRELEDRPQSKSYNR